MKKPLILVFLLTWLVTQSAFAQLRLTLDPIAAPSSSTVTVPITVQNISNCGAFTAFFHYNSAALTFQGYDTAGTLLSNSGVSVIDSNNTIRIAYFDFVPLNAANATLLKVRFTFNGNPSALIWNTARTEFSIGSTPTIPVLENGRVFNAASTVGFTSQCQDATVCELGTATYSVTATNALTYQWQISNDSTGNGFSNISGATQATYNRANVGIADDRKYVQCVVSDASASSLSGLARVFVNPNNFVQVLVSSNPSSAVCSGSSITYSVSTNPVVANPIYNWTVNGQSVGSAATYTSTSLVNGDVVGCQVTSASECLAPSVTSVSSLTASINPLPTVYSVAGGGARCAGDNNTLNVTLSGSQVGTNYTLVLAGNNLNTLAGTGSGLTFSGLNQSGSYTVSATSAAGCSSNMTGSASILVNPLPSFTLTAGSTTISSGGNTQLQATQLPAASYSWTPNTNIVGASTRNPVVSPTQTTKYYCTVVNQATGCSSIDSITITVLPAPTVNAGSDFSVCASSSAVSLTGTPSGGTWSGVGVSGSTFNPPSSAGTYNLTYTVTQLGISYSDVVVATVNARPTVTLSSFASVCAGSSAFALSGGSPSGGSYTVDGSSASNFNPTTPGNYTVVYSYTDANGCSNTASRNINVTSTTAVSITVSPRDSVNAGGSVSLTCTQLPLGSYAWTGSGLSSTTAQVVLATPSSTTTYTVVGTNLNGCTSSASKTIYVLPLPTVNAGVDDTLCVGSQAINLVGSPAGGTWSGSGVSGSTFNPTTVGTFTITYTYNQLGTNFTDTRVFTVAANPSVSLASFASVCEGTSSINLTGGTPSGGTYTVNGNNATSFNPTTPGTYNVTYTVTNAFGCSSSASQNIVVNAKTSVSWPALSAMTILDPVVVLNNTASPTGGVFSGSGVSLNGSNYEFDPAIAGAGTFALTYTYVNANGCTTVANNSITVTVPSFNIWNGNGNWTTASNWTLGTPTNGQNVRINSGTVSVNTNATVAKMEVAAGATVNIGSSNTTGQSYSITVTDSLTNNGGLNVLNPVSAVSSVNENHLVQGNGSVLSGSGSYAFTRWTGNSNDTIYNYLSSPVQGGTIAMLGATDSRNHYTYNASTGWVQLGLNATMNPGIGYSSTGTTNGRSLFTASGSNRFNNGTISANISGDTTLRGWNLIGNPYPSSISAAQFLTDNPNLFQTVWFWSQEIASTWPTGTLNGDYASWNFTGGIAGSQGGAIPNGQISAGQGLFIKVPASNSSLSSVSFNNGQRTNSNATVFRTGGFERAWINATGPNQSFNQTLIAFGANATNGFDPSFDAEKIKGNTRIALYSTLGSQDLGIQALAPRATTLERVNVGLDVAFNGNYELALAQTEGFPSGTVVSVRDFNTGILHNLGNGPYSFNVGQTGSLRNRFEIQFSGQISGINTDQLSTLFIHLTNDRLHIAGLEENEKILSVEIVDLTGKMVYSQKPGLNGYTPIDLNFNQGIYFARIHTNKQLVARKFLINQ